MKNIKDGVDKGWDAILRYETATLKKCKGFESQMAMWTKNLVSKVKLGRGSSIKK